MSMHDLTEHGKSFLREMLTNPEDEEGDFEKFYKYVFIYHRTGMYKNVEVETCKALLRMIFKDRYVTIDKFFEFVDS